MDKHNLFLQAIHETKKVKIKAYFYDKGFRERICIPFDFGFSRKFHDKRDRYHFYDLDSPDGSHNLSILPTQLIKITLLEETFEPKDYVK